MWLRRLWRAERRVEGWLCCGDELSWLCVNVYDMCSVRGLIGEIV